MEKVVKYDKIHDSGIHIDLGIVRFLLDSYSLTESQWEDGTCAESPTTPIIDVTTALWAASVFLLLPLESIFYFKWCLYINLQM